MKFAILLDEQSAKAIYDWFEFVLDDAKSSGLDWYEIDMHNGKVRIRGNKGLSLTTGLNYYFKYFCSVQIARQTRQVKMPAEIVGSSQYDPQGKSL